MNKRQKAIRDKQPGHTMSAAAWEFATDDYKELRKNKKMKNVQFKEYRHIILEGKFSKSLIAKALKIAKKSGGEMTKAWKAIEKIATGLGDDPTVYDALRLANEGVVTEWNAGSRRCAGGDGRRKLLKGKMSTDAEEEVDEAVSLKKGAKIKVPHKGKKVTGKVVRYVPQRGSASPYYVVDVGEYQSIEVPEHKVKQYNESLAEDRYAVTFQKGTRVGARDFKIIRVKAKDEDDAIKKAKAGKGDGPKIEKGYKFSSIRTEEVDLDEGKMKELHGYIAQGKSAGWIAKKMGVDVKTIKSLMDEYGEETDLDEGREKEARQLVDSKKEAMIVKAKKVIVIDKKDLDKYLKKGWGLAEKNELSGLTEKADKNEVIELKLFIENDPRLYKSKLVPIVKNIQRKMKSGKYDHKKAPKLWMYLVKEGQKLYSKEFDGLKFGTDVHKQVAQELADEYRDEIETQDGEMFEAKLYLQFKDFRGDGLDEATGNEIKKYMKSEWKVGVKASKVGSNGKYMRAVGKIPNKFRALIIKKFIPDAKIQDMNNINYGNIRDNMVALRTEEWDKLINEDLNVATEADWDALDAGLNEGKYKIDHKTFTSAVQEALKVADKAGYEVDEDDYFHQVATGPKKPSEGKTNKYSIALTKRGKPQKKALQIQIYGKGKHGFELNCYIS